MCIMREDFSHNRKASLDEGGEKEQVRGGRVFKKSSCDIVSSLHRSCTSRHLQVESVHCAGVWPSLSQCTSSWCLESILRLVAIQVV